MKESLKEDCQVLMFTTDKVKTSSSILLYTVPVSIPVTRLELAGRGNGSVWWRGGRCGKGEGGGAARWRKQRRGGGGQETRGHRSVSAYVREIPQIGHSPGSDGLKLHSGEWAHTTCNHTHIIQAHAYSILWEAEVWPTLREDAARCMGAGVWNLTLR